MASAHTWRLALTAFGLLAFVGVAAAERTPCFVEDFEGGLTRWRRGDDGAAPLVAVADRAFAGGRSAFSGPPGRRRVSRADLPPGVGRLEVRFYDDLAPNKQQMAIAVGLPKQMLGISSRGAAYYEFRVGTTYTLTPAKRTKGWHHFAWVCDGKRTAAFIDGASVGMNPTLDRISGIVLGSFWDASMGWYDDVRAYPRTDADAATVTEAEKTLAERETQRLAELSERLEADVALLKTKFRIRPHKPLGAETPLSRECTRRLLRTVRYTQPNFRDWPHAPGCRYHKRDGHREYDVRQNATVALGYATLLLGDYDAKVAGVPRDQLEGDLVGLLRYIAITHKANLLPTGDGRPWGDAWQSALWAAWAGRAAWLAWDRLDDRTRLLFARLIVHEADRFNTRPPDSGFRADTKAEENAWNSMIICLAECMFPHHPNARLWRERAIVYLINSYARESDRQETKVVDGRPVKERVTCTTIHPDFTLENHHRVHPDYLGCFGLMLRNAPLYRAAGIQPPEALTYNVPQAWHVLKHMTATNASYFYVNGQDWWPHRHGSPLTIAALTSVVFNDPDSAFLERQALAFTARMHARFDDGRLWDRREYNYANAEESSIGRYAELVLLHRLLGDGPPPATREQFFQHVSGVRHFEIGGFVTHRTPEKFVSFAWVNGVMGLVYPRDDTWFTSPSERGLVGYIQCEGLKDTRPKVLGRKVAAGKDSFSLAARIRRCEGAIEQWIALFSLPEGPVIYMERLVAKKDVTVKEVATGTLPILNEDAPGIAPNRRTVYFQDSKMTIPGVSKASRGLIRFESRWANVDGRFGVVTHSSGKAWRDRHAYARCRLEEELIANYHVWPKGERFAAGKPVLDSIVVVVPNQAVGQTAKLQFTRFGHEGFHALRLGTTVVLGNLGPEPATVDVPGGHRFTLAPLETVITLKAPADLLPSP
ncbi:hypothetical protein HQ576_15505 [bacterium]|nr:hypothetical protein [bacterium]